MSKCTFCIQRMLRTGKRDNKVCVPLNFALICTQPLQTCSYSYLVLFVTVKISYFRSMHYIWPNISNIWSNFNIGLIARTVQVFANTTIDHNFVRNTCDDLTCYAPKVLLVWIFWTAAAAQPAEQHSKQSALNTFFSYNSVHLHRMICSSFLYWQHAELLSYIN